MNKPATQNAYERDPADRSFLEQMALNRSVVGAAEDERLRDGVQSTKWERRGLFGRLRRRPDLREAA